MNHHYPHPGWSSSREGDVMYVVGEEGSFYELLPENQMINSNNVPNALQLDQLKAALNKRCLELVNRKRIIFH